MSTAFNSSYLFGEDKISGWGWRYFFSFYSEFGEEKNSIVFETSVFICIFVLSLLANLVIATALFKYPEMRTVNNCFLLNLTAADLAFVAGIPALVYARMDAEWRLGGTICKLLPYSQVSVLEVCPTLHFMLKVGRKEDFLFMKVELEEGKIMNLARNLEAKTSGGFRS